MSANTADIVRISGGVLIIIICWVIGRFDYSFLWLCLIITLYVVKVKTSNKREEKQRTCQLLAVKEEDVVTLKLQDLPAWVQFPDVERVEWLNKIALQLWPYIGEFARKFIIRDVEPKIKSSLPGPFKSFAFEEIDLGSVPVRVTGVETYVEDVGRDRIVVDIEIFFAGDCEFVVSVGAFKGGMRDLLFRGKLRLILTPLLAQTPIIGGIRAFFLDNPEIDFDLTGVGEVTEIPGLRGAIRDVLNDQVEEACVLPNEINLTLTSEVDMVNLVFSEPDGVIVVRVIEARNLKAADSVINLGILKGKVTGRSDPYVVITVGSQIFKTRVVESNLNPVWDEYFEATVEQAGGQKVIANLFDKDTVGDDSDLGFLHVDIEPIRKKGSDNSWRKLEGAKQGELHLELHWLILSSNPDALKVHETVFPSNKALLMVYVDNITDLPKLSTASDPHPYVEISIGNETKKTSYRTDTRNPVYQKKFTLWVQDPNSQVLNVEVKDAKKDDRSLGEVDISIENLLKTKNLEMIQETWLLTLPTNVAKITMSLRIRMLTKVDPFQEKKQLD